MDDVTEIEWRRMLELQTWMEFYEKTYIFVGQKSTVDDVERFCFKCLCTGVGMEPFTLICIS